MARRQPASDSTVKPAVTSSSSRKQKPSLPEKKPTTKPAAKRKPAVATPEVMKVEKPKSPSKSTKAPSTKSTKQTAVPKRAPSRKSEPASDAMALVLAEMQRLAAEVQRLSSQIEEPRLPVTTEQTGFDEDTIVSPAETAALLAGLDDEAPHPANETEASPPEPSSSDHSSDAEISATALQEVMAEVSETVDPVSESQPEEADEQLSDDDIALLIAASDPDAAPAEATGSTFDLTEPADEPPTATIEESQELVEEIAASATPGGFGTEPLDESAMAELVRMTIASQDAPVPEPEPVAQDFSDNADVLSAAQLTALLNTPDPAGSLGEDEAYAMDEAEVAQLMAQADGTEGNLEKFDHLPYDEPSSYDEGAGPSEPTPTPADSRSEAAPVSVAATDVDKSAVLLVPAPMAVRAMALPVQIHNGKLVCHVAEPIDQEALDRISQHVEMAIECVVRPIDEVVVGIRTAYADLDHAHARQTAITDKSAKSSVLTKWLKKSA